MLDVREFAYAKLEEAKEIFRRENVLVPTGYLIKPDGTSEVYMLLGESKKAWRKVTNDFKRAARDAKAIATITIRGCTFQAFPPWEKEGSRSKKKQTPQWLREAIEAGSGKCVSMDIEVPGQPTINVMVPYSFTKTGEIKFEAAEEGPLDFKGPAPPESREEEGPLN